MRQGVTLRIDTDYNNVGKVLYILNDRRIDQQDSAYTDKVSITVRLPIEERESLEKALTESTCGTASFESLGDSFYVDKNPEILV